MKFVNDGPDIPPGLIEAQERGEIVFVCGAGVSRTVGLPSFERLTRQVYAELNEDWVGHPVEAAGMDPKNPAFDRTLFALQARLGGGVLKQAEQARRQIVEAVQRSLAPPRGKRLVHHANILRLSRDAEMRSRLVTTNFDTLFERSRRQSHLDPIASRATADMPGPGSADFEGVMHLHGRIEDLPLGLRRSDLVLTSAEFGEAYLRSGWAARYVYDLARAATLVIVGYGADDPPVRYLLEVLSADRSRFPDLRPIFAFAPVVEGQATEVEVEARWRLQGVTPIPYAALEDGADHSRLYDTLALWADYQEDPTGWRRAKARDLMAGGPDTLADGDWERLAWALGRGDGGRILGEVNPDPSWWEALRTRSLVGSKGAYASDWIRRRLEDPAMFDQVVGDRNLDLGTLSDLSRNLNAIALPKPWDLGWRLLAQRGQFHARGWDDGWHGMMQRLKRGETGLGLRRSIADALTPRPYVDRPFRWPGKERDEDAPAPIQHLRDLVDLDFRKTGHTDIRVLIEAWPADQDVALLRTLVRALLDGLEEATEYGFANPDYDRASEQIKSISPHGQNQHNEGFYDLVRLIADLLQRLVQVDQKAVASIAGELGASPFVLAKRLQLHVLSWEMPFDATVGAATLLALSDQEFWLGSFKRELMRLLVARWPGFSQADRDALEARLLSGPPRELFLEDPALDAEIVVISQLEATQRLGRIRNEGGVLSAKANRVVDERLVEHPAWRELTGERAEFSGWSEFHVGEQGDVGLLDGITPERLVDAAHDLAERDPFNQGEIWRKFSTAEPERALAGLVAQAKANAWPAWAWTPFFWAMAEIDNAELERRLVTFLAGVPDEDLKPFSASIASWMQRRDGLKSVPRGEVLALWDKLVSIVSADPQEARADDTDPLFESWNRAPGHLARVLIDELVGRAPLSGERLPEDLVARFDRLAQMRGHQGQLANITLAGQLPYLHQVDPGWADEALVPKMAADHPWAPGLWSSLVRNRVLGTLPLVERLKPAFLAALADPARFVAAGEGLIGHLMVMAINPLGGERPAELPSLPEIKRALAATSDENRRRAAFNLFERVRDVTPEAGASLWRRLIGPAFRAVWPMEPALQSSDTSLFLVWLAQNVGEAFPDAVSAVLPALVAGGRTNSMFDLMDEDKDALFAAHPRATLELYGALVDPASPPRELIKRLTKLAEAEPALTREAGYRRLLGIARRASA